MGKVNQIVVILILFMCSCLVKAALRGEAEIRLDYYSSAPLYADQSAESSQPGLASSVDWDGRFGENNRAKLSLFAKYQSESERDYSGDVQEAWLSLDAPSSEWRFGQLMEYWGVLEAENIVDIINPRDAEEDFQGDFKLGIPGMAFSYFSQQTEYNFWLLPYSRERQLAYGEDRFRNFPLEKRDGEFEKGQNNTAVAIRANRVDDQIEFSVSYYYGHARMPWFELQLDNSNQPTGLTPMYDLINQASFEMLWLPGNSIVKLESFYQKNKVDDFFAAGIGFEREIPKLGTGNASLSFYGEAYYDGRDQNLSQALAIFQRDIFLGTRLALNDVSSSEFQFRWTYDLEYESSLIDIRAERRIGKNWFLNAVLYKFLHVESDPALETFQNDDRLRMNLIWNF